VTRLFVPIHQEFYAFRLTRVISLFRILGDSEYGCFINSTKSLINFDMEQDGQKINRLLRGQNGQFINLKKRKKKSILFFFKIIGF